MSKSEKSDNRYTFYRYFYIPFIVCVIGWNAERLVKDLIRSLDEIRQEMQRQKP